MSVARALNRPKAICSALGVPYPPSISIHHGRPCLPGDGQALALDHRHHRWLARNRRMLVTVAMGSNGKFPS